MGPSKRPHLTTHSIYKSHASGGIRALNPSKRVAADPRLRPRVQAKGKSPSIKFRQTQNLRGRYTVLIHRIICGERIQRWYIALLMGNVYSVDTSHNLWRTYTAFIYRTKFKYVFREYCSAVEIFQGTFSSLFVKGPRRSSCGQSPASHHWRPYSIPG
jgi:hypothetical protein